MLKDVLVVDDQPGIRLLLTDILMNEGYNVTTASNGKEAIEKLVEKHFATILLDYKLPIVDGVEVLKKIEELNLRIPAIVMSGLVEKIENELESFPIVKTVLAKPFDIQQIPILVEQSIDSL
ncbi:response regulator [Oceanobacillus luteolus]|uniref:Response regulator n=1 Tax=Oceanobacillus luteolus TaxID=1274358 RepID=A0ABW4HMS5_9BACI|nr:response regulator [Oceanobacillus luteolus]MCM3741460.1 response regulator [Oceanobacillus luteolus]